MIRRLLIGILLRIGGSDGEELDVVEQESCVMFESDEVLELLEGDACVTLS